MKEIKTPEGEGSWALGELRPTKLVMVQQRDTVMEPCQIIDKSRNLRVMNSSLCSFSA
jgi:hypothetical protein